MCAIAGEGEETDIEGLIFVPLSILDYGPLPIMSLNYMKIIWLNSSSLDMECLFIGYSVAF